MFWGARLTIQTPIRMHLGFCSYSCEYVSSSMSQLRPEWHCSSLHSTSSRETSGAQHTWAGGCTIQNATNPCCSKEDICGGQLAVAWVQRKCQRHLEHVQALHAWLRPQRPQPLCNKTYLHSALNQGRKAPHCEPESAKKCIPYNVCPVQKLLA
jgi:hypothetical protein